MRRLDESHPAVEDQAVQGQMVLWPWMASLITADTSEILDENTLSCFGGRLRCVDKF